MASQTGQFLLVGQHDLGVSLFLRFDQFIGLVQAGVLDVVVAGQDAGDAKEANFHGQCLGCRPPKVKRESESCLPSKAVPPAPERQKDGGKKIKTGDFFARVFLPAVPASERAGGGRGTTGRWL